VKSFTELMMRLVIFGGTHVMISAATVL